MLEYKETAVILLLQERLSLCIIENIMRTSPSGSIGCAARSSKENVPCTFFVFYIEVM